MSYMSVIGLFIKSELRVDADTILSSFVSGSTLRERIVQLPLNIVVEVQRTGDFERQSQKG